MLNKIIAAGRLTATPELKMTPSGTPVTNFTLACERDFKDSNGEKGTDFIEVVCWRNTAEFVSKYFSKGRMAIVSGRLQVRPYTDRDGNKRKAAEIVAESIYFGDAKLNEEVQKTEHTLNLTPQDANHGLEPIDDEDLPF